MRKIELESSQTVMWICNVPVPEIAKACGLNTIYSGGWLSGMLNSLN